VTGFEAAAQVARDGDPYPQAVVRAGAGVFLAATGGGGGAAQLFPARLLAPLLDEAWLAVTSSGARGATALAAFFGRADAAMEGEAGAHLVAATADAGALWLGNVGLGRAFRVTGAGLEQLSRDDSYLQDFLDGHPSPEEVAAFPYHGIVTAMLNGRWRQARPRWRPTRVELRPGEGLLLATEVVYASTEPDALARWAAEAVTAVALEAAAEALFTRARAHSSAPVVFERTAAMVLVRRAPGA